MMAIGCASNAMAIARDCFPAMAMTGPIAIREAALKNRIKQFVIDGEAVVLGVDGVPDFNALHSRKHDEEVQLYAFDILTLDGEDLRPPLEPAQDQSGAAACPPTRRHLRCALRAGRDRPRPVPGCLQHGA
jgi:hypothetical protein